MKIEFFVPGRPVGKERPRVYGNRAFTPTKTKDYEAAVGWAYKAAGGKMMEGGVKVTIEVVFAPPESLSKTRREKMLYEACLHRPDLDNVAKSVLDGLQGVAFKDDAQVVELVCHKKYGAQTGLYAVVSDGAVSVSMSIYDEEEIHRNCTVQIWRNSVTGEESVGWWENGVE